MTYTKIYVKEKEIIKYLMTEFFYKQGTYKVDHSTFGGIINESDFYTSYRGKDNVHGSSIAGRIVADQKFDEQCRKNRNNTNMRRNRNV